MQKHLPNTPPPIERTIYLMKHISTAILFLAFISSISLAGMQTEAQTAYPFIGTWIMNLEKSDSGSFPLPKSMQVSIEVHDGVIEEKVTVVLADGMRHEAVSFRCDGKDYPVVVTMASALQGLMSCEAVDANTYGFAVKDLEGRVLNSYKRTMSADRKAFAQATGWLNQYGFFVNTIKTSRQDIKGSVIVFEKQ